MILECNELILNLGFHIDIEAVTVTIDVCTEIYTVLLFISTLLN